MNLVRFAEANLAAAPELSAARRILAVQRDHGDLLLEQLFGAQVTL
jgi:hypothetical protein